MGEVASTYTTAAAGLIDGAINTRELQQKGRAQSLPKGEAGMQAVLHTMCRASRLTAPMGSLSQGLDALPPNPPPPPLWTGPPPCAAPQGRYLPC